MSITGIRDVDRLIMQVTDDASLLQMMKSNKYLLREGEKIFEARMKVSYPILANRKPFFEKWSKYYLSNIYFLNSLKEQYGIEYIPVISFDPAALYRVARVDNKDKTSGGSPESPRPSGSYRTAVYLAQCYAELGDKEKILTFMKSVKPTLQISRTRMLRKYVLQFLLKFKNEKLYNELKLKWNIDNLKDVHYVVQSRDLPFIDKILDQLEAEDTLEEVFPTAIEGAAEIGDWDLIQHLTERYNRKIPFLVTLLSSAINGCQINFIKSTMNDIDELDNKAKKELRKLLVNALSEYLVGDTYDFLSQEKAYQIVDYILTTVKKLGASKEEIIETLTDGEYPEEITLEEFYEDFFDDPLLSEFVKNKLSLF